MHPSIRFSIITICFNNLKDVMATSESVEIQALKPFEHIIIDGSSNTEIKTWMEANAQPQYRRAIHERDNGIADAFNKGIALAQGDVLLLLNSGDCLANNETLSIVSRAFLENPGISWLHGKYHFERAGQWVILGKPYDKRKLYRGMRSICHQTMYIKKEIYNRYGGYSSAYKICMDYDFLVRMRNEPFLFIPQVLATFAPGGISMQRSKQILAENEKSYRQHIGYSWKQTLWNYRLRLLIALQNSAAGKYLYRIKVLLGLENM